DEVSTLATIPTAVPANWFPETESAGAKQAWQTYSENPQEIHSWSSEWQTAQDGSLEQPSSQGGSDLSYLDDLAHMEPAKGADWFENEVIQYDEYGRPRAPTDRSDKYYVEWNRTEKSVALKCAAPGCTANASLQVFGNTSANEYTMCRMSFMVYATDFDDQYSRERIEWLVVNGREAKPIVVSKIGVQTCFGRLRPCCEPGVTAVHQQRYRQRLCLRTASVSVLPGHGH
ncbi:unnamed protein product, partial [Polarella glacialis]